MNWKKRFSFFLGPALFFSILTWFEADGLTTEGVAVLASTAWIATWWIANVIPIAATALLPIVLFPLTNGLSLSQTTASYGHKYIFLFIGGFIIAIAIEKWNLHRRIALNIIHFVGTNVRSIILGFMIATAALSMWISNTATAVMLLPVGMAIVSQYHDNPDTPENENKLFGKALMLAIAYSSSIGGMATLIGTPPNLVLAGVVETTYGVDISFAQWFSFGFPISIILLTICWFYLTRLAFDFPKDNFSGGKQEIKRQLSLLGAISKEERTVFTVFLFTAFFWISRSFLLKRFIPAIDDTIIAVAMAILLFMLPATNKKPILVWEDLVKLPWGILLLFGGGMALASGFESSGLALFIGNKMSMLTNLSLFLILLLLIASVNFLTEVTSNLATTAMLLPILVPLAGILGIHPYILLVSATVAASCAFMLPVATPPNAVVFGSGLLEIDDMVKKGFWMNLLSILILTVFVYFLLPAIWQL